MISDTVQVLLLRLLIKKIYYCWNWKNIHNFQGHASIFSGVFSLRPKSLLGRSSSTRNTNLLIDCGNIIELSHVSNSKIELTHLQKKTPKIISDVLYQLEGCTCCCCDGDFESDDSLMNLFTTSLVENNIDSCQNSEKQQVYGHNTSKYLRLLKKNWVNTKKKSKSVSRQFSFETRSSKFRKSLSTKKWDIENNQ